MDNYTDVPRVLNTIRSHIRGKDKKDITIWIYGLIQQLSPEISEIELESIMTKSDEYVY